METLDVYYLDTNVSRESAVQAVSGMVAEHQASLNLCGLSVVQIMTLLNECLRFRWCGEYYGLVRRLAMGHSSRAPFTAKVEDSLLKPKPTAYCIFTCLQYTMSIDNCFSACSTQTGMDTYSLS